MWQLLNNALIWESSRIGLDAVFGLYQKRFQTMKNWGLLDKNPSIIDIGCGIGQYANVTQGKYLGIDMNEPYITHARNRHKRANQTFRCADVTVLLDEKASFDLVLMVDFLHHLSDSQCLHLLTVAAQLSTQNIISFEPITHQPHPVGRWIVENDRGDYVRPLDELLQLFDKAGLKIQENNALRLGPINTRSILARPQ